jgi:hypothetical protein
MLFYPATLPLSSKTLNYTAGVIRRHRRAIGSPPRRRLTPRQACPARPGLPPQGNVCGHSRIESGEPGA